MTREEIVKAVKEGVITIEELKEELEELSEQDKDNICLMHLLLCDKVHGEVCKFYEEERLDSTWGHSDHKLWTKEYTAYKKLTGLKRGRISAELNLIRRFREEVTNLGHWPRLFCTYVHNINKGYFNKELKDPLPTHEGSD